MNTLCIPVMDTGSVSDGYHTFDELYQHRNTLFLCLMAAFPGASWFALKHNDGTQMEGWFIAGMRFMESVTYHLPVNLLPYARHTGALELGKAPPWDGHTPGDVVDRLLAWVSDAYRVPPPLTITPYAPRDVVPMEP